MTPLDERLYSTRRLGLVRRLNDEGVSSQLAHTLVSQWEAEAARRGLEPSSPDFWRNGASWVAKERRTERSKGSDVLRQVQDGLDDARRHPVKELGIPDYHERSGHDSAERDDAWKHRRDDARRTKRRASGRPGDAGRPKA